MGAFTSRSSNDAVEETDVGSNHLYRYPPKMGNYFGSHFIMGGERFDTPQPESYLFGENSDLNFLGSRPTSFPYPPPQANEPTKTLKSLVNIRKESVRFVKVQNDKPAEVEGTSPQNTYNIEFTFDADAKVAITIYYFCSEEISPSGITLVPKDSLTSETFHYKKGFNQHFVQPTHIFNPNLFAEDDLSFNQDNTNYPVAIHCVVEEGNDDCKHSHTTICVIDHHTDGTYTIRALKQKIFVDGLCYLLQEIYGIENKALNKVSIDDETDDNGSECVICMSDIRDTLILPCRHLCLCNSCADSLRYQANNCPICRAPFRALLQIKAVQKRMGSNNTFNNAQNQANNENIPNGYEVVPLIEALNGPPQYSNTSVISSPITEGDKLEDGGKLFEGIDKVDDGKAQNDIGKSKKNLKNVDSEGTQQPPHPPKTDSQKPHQHKHEKKRKSQNHHDRESLQFVNERKGSKQLKEKQTPVEPEEDSDNEKFTIAPLLKEKTKQRAFPIDGVEESIDDTDTEADESKNSLAKTFQIAR
ncbi:RNF157 family protein [Megaselia abdita]